MNLKQIRKNLAYLAGWFGLTVCSLIIKGLPAAWVYGFADNLAKIGYWCAGKQRTIALDSLRIAFGRTKTDEEIREIAQICFTYMSKSAVELMFLLDKPELLRSQVRLQGEEYLQEALAKGKGVILVSAHFGNFPLLLARLSLQGYQVSGIMRQMKDARVEKIFLDKRNRYKVRTIYSQPRNLCVDTTIRTLRNNELVFIPIDQNFGTAGVFVDFFGQKAATATGPVVLAQRTGAALLPCFILRQKDDSHVIVFEPALELAHGKSAGETITINIQRLTDIIESYIRRYPAEWGWIHRRWKSKQSK
jgi:KDO2-lipid IV(A) lauroyltransferase